MQDKIPLSFYKQFIEVILVVGSANLNSGGISKYLVVEENNSIQLPNRLLKPTQTTLSLASELLKEYTNLDAKINNAGWIPLYLGGVFDTPNRDSEKRVLAISYGGIIPAIIKPIAPACGRDFDELYQKKGLISDHMDIVSLTTLRV